MAREESDREDILREATGLVNRIELRCPWFDDSIVVGFRRNGAASLFIGQEEVYQFDTQYQLRRGFLRGKLLKAEQGKLIELTRHRTSDQTQLIRTDLAEQATREYLRQLDQRLDQLHQSLLRDEEMVLGEVAMPGNDVREQVVDWLNQRPQRIELALVPGVG